MLLKLLQHVKRAQFPTRSDAASDKLQQGAVDFLQQSRQLASPNSYGEEPAAHVSGSQAGAKTRAIVFVAGCLLIVYSSSVQLVVVVVDDAVHVRMCVCMHVRAHVCRLLAR